MKVGVVLFEPVLAFLDSAAVFTVLRESIVLAGGIRYGEVVECDGWLYLLVKAPYLLLEGECRLHSILLSWRA